MATARSFTLLAGFLLTRLSTAAPKADVLVYAGADSQKVDRRQTGLIPTPVISNGGMHTIPMPTIPILTIITMPDHSEEPVTVTSQNQLVTFYVPVLTICSLRSSNHSAPFGPSASGFATAASNASILPTAPITPSTPIPIPPFLPISPPKIIIAEKRQLASYHASSCSVSYTPTVTRICATTLSPLAAPLIPITACDQSVTFSSEFGYTLVPASRTGHDDGTMIRKRQEASSTIATLTTFYVVPWSELSAGVVPTSVLAEVCSSGGVGCTAEAEVRNTQANDVTKTIVKTVEVGAIVTGPANVVVGPDLNTITVSGLEPTSIAFSTAFDGTQTSTSVNTVKTAGSGAQAAVTTTATQVAETSFGDDSSNTDAAAAQGAGSSVTDYLSSTDKAISTSTLTTSTTIMVSVAASASGLGTVDV